MKYPVDRLIVAPLDRCVRIVKLYEAGKLGTGKHNRKVYELAKKWIARKS